MNEYDALAPREDNATTETISRIHTAAVTGLARHARIIISTKGETVANQCIYRAYCSDFDLTFGVESRTQELRAEDELLSSSNTITPTLRLLRLKLVKRPYESTEVSASQCTRLEPVNRDFIRLLQNNNLDIIAIAETWIPRFLSSTLCSYLAATSTNNRDTAGRPHGGVLLFMRPSEQPLFRYTCSFDAVTSYTDT